ncbi:Chromatin modification-related protein EAF1 [Trametes pubescens]|uniref:Vacuolar import and degradation protein 21 n=1 Tax=Trametes pubescens TaxID=154538 RepID=A0A1M2VJX6_TRAPU|nr:Chromatin modification-related protein EAF1 [Trametes pubescens]
MSDSAESLIEERVMQLQEISKRRNALLREMYHLVQKRDNLGSVIALEDDSEEENLQLFLERFDLEKHPDSGCIDNLQDEEVALPVTPPAYSPVIGHEPVQDNDISELPVSPSLEPPPAAEQDIKQEEQEPPEPQDHDVDMDIDETTAHASSQPPEVLDAPHEEPSRTASREPSSVPDVKLAEGASADIAEAEGSQSRDASPAVQAAAAVREVPLVDTSLESPMPQSVDHSSTVSYTEPSVTRESSSARVSPPRPQRSPSSAAQVAGIEESTIKAEPLDDEPMDVAESSPPPQEPQAQYVAPSQLNELTQQDSEDHIMDILAPAQLASPAEESGDHHHMIDYSIPQPPEWQTIDFAFGSDAAAGLPNMDITPVQPFGPEPPYPIPPLSLMPSEFHRRGKTTSKRERKRDKERDGVSRSDWQPLSLVKWAAILQANPVHDKLQHATKCLSTRDWSVGLQELRLVRTFERIESLKAASGWSFRQIKKQRGVGGLTKTHWDYLMDEMKWMRSDFREERRWKLALAYNLAHAVLEWHEAGTLEERIRLGICVMWKPPLPGDVEMAEASEVDGPFRDSQEAEETGPDSRETETPLNDYGSDEESEDEQDKEQQDVIDALEPGTALQDALEQLEAHAQSQPGSQEGVSMKPKIEEIEGVASKGDASQSREESAMNVDASKAEPAQVPKDTQPKPAKRTAPEPGAHPALKTTSRNPILGKSAAGGDGTHGKPKSKASQYAHLRDRIVYSDLDKLFLDLDDLDLVKGMSDLSTDDFSPAAPPAPADLASIFPDLQPYEMLDVAPPLPALDTRKKSDRKGDKDDPNRRADDAAYSKLVPLSKFMHVKPTLVGTLKPASNWKDGHWKRIEETPVFADIEMPSARPIEDNLCALFEGGRPAPPGVHLPPGAPRERGDTRKAPPPPVWTPADDALLRQMVWKYTSNWALVAEAYNSARVTIAMDRRTGADCLARWTTLLNNEMAAGEDERSRTMAVASPRMETRKQTANQSVAGSSSNDSGQMMVPKKKVRHSHMHDTLRKAAKRREAVQKSNAAPRPKATAVHETHGSVTKMARFTPAELSRMKADKEARDAAELSLRRRNDEIARQHLLREQAQRVQGLPPNAQQPQQSQTPLIPQAAAANGVPRPSSSLPQAQMVQQIRSQVGISQQQQQQRIAAALAASNNARMSPPQISAAQAAHFRALAAQQGQASGQAGGQGPAQMQQPSAASAALSAAAPALSAAHLSPSFAARATSSSPGLPQQSPPLPAASPANAAVARPPSVPGQPVQGVPMTPMLHAQNVAQYYLQMQQRGLPVTQDQLQAMVAQIQAQQQQQRQAQQHQAHQYAAQQQQQQQPGPGQQGGGYQHS